MKKLRVLTAFIVAFVLVFAMAGCDLEWLFSVSRSPTTPVHLIAESEAESDPVRPIAEREEREVTGESFFERQNSLLETVEQGFKPTFDEDGADVERVYDAAVSVLDRYILSSFSAYERVHAIHDYLCAFTVYDDELYNSYLSGGTVSKEHDSFNLAGVFLNNKAVCDGISKSFSLLCGIEGIKSARIVGEYRTQTSVAHAWNKVEIEGKWYNVDCTLDSARIALSDEVQTLVHHGFFLLSDAAVSDLASGGHFADPDIAMNPDNEIASESYPVYENMKIEIGSESYDAFVTTEEQLKTLLSAVRKAGRRKVGKLDVKLDLEDVDMSDAAAFDTMLKEAITNNVGRIDFTYNVESGVKPYIRYPSGAMLLLLYA